MVWIEPHIECYHCELDGGDCPQTNDNGGVESDWNIIDCEKGRGLVFSKMLW